MSTKLSQAISCLTIVSAFSVYRDSHIAAYLGWRNRLFWFAKYEPNDQDAVFAVGNNLPIFRTREYVRDLSPGRQRAWVNRSLRVRRHAGLY
jgi:hypothetical protein